jgi:hypothetical protein
MAKAGFLYRIGLKGTPPQRHVVGTALGDASLALHLLTSCQKQTDVWNWRGRACSWGRWSSD